MEDEFVTDLWVASPAGAKERKQTTLGLVPLAGSEWGKGKRQYGAPVRPPIVAVPLSTARLNL